MAYASRYSRADTCPIDAHHLTTESMTRKKILVIGANGFTGRRILDDLSHNVFYQTTGCSLHDDICPHSGNYHFIRTDICNRQAVENFQKYSRML